MATISRADELTGQVDAVGVDRSTAFSGVAKRKLRRRRVPRSWNNGIPSPSPEWVTYSGAITIYPRFEASAATQLMADRRSSAHHASATTAG